MRLFHFSEDGDIGAFVPRPVKTPSARPPGEEWLNGPLVWAIDEWHQPMYLFPRECPRVLIWPTGDTSQEDREKWFGQTDARMIAFIENDWVSRHSGAAIWRYELTGDGFESLHDAGMWVSRETVEPVFKERITDLGEALSASGAELRAIPVFDFVEALRASTLHVSAIRMRNAERSHALEGQREP